MTHAFPTRRILNRHGFGMQHQGLGYFIPKSLSGIWKGSSFPTEALLQVFGLVQFRKRRHSRIVDKVLRHIIGPIHLLFGRHGVRLFPRWLSIAIVGLQHGGVGRNGQFETRVRTPTRSTVMNFVNLVDKRPSWPGAPRPKRQDANVLPVHFVHERPNGLVLAHGNQVLVNIKLSNPIHVRSKSESTGSLGRILRRSFSRRRHIVGSIVANLTRPGNIGYVSWKEVGNGFQ
mmetsp:Transcript_29739/g.81708  ORF Transcript_29739/g.81708 Transcript_29739/m.81708 type:complete len:231 (+) Transcript_29739:394-1086(+)